MEQMIKVKVFSLCFTSNMEFRIFELIETLLFAHNYFYLIIFVGKSYAFYFIWLANPTLLHILQY